jgi:hypothetical protein
MNTYKIGDIVYLTPAAQDFLSRNRGPSFNINVVGRLGKILDIYDWKTPRGKKILETRKSHTNWDKLPSLEFRYVIVTAYPELKAEGNQEQGLSIPEIFCEFHPMAPDKKIPLFRKWPTDILSSIVPLAEETKEKPEPKSKAKNKVVKNVPRPTNKQGIRKSR